MHKSSLPHYQPDRSSSGPAWLGPVSPVISAARTIVFVLQSLHNCTFLRHAFYDIQMVLDSLCCVCVSPVTLLSISRVGNWV